jgi:hypothetical protein
VINTTGMLMMNSLINLRFELQELLPRRLFVGSLERFPSLS